MFCNLPAGLGHLASQAMLVQALTRSQRRLIQVPAHLCCAELTCARASTFIPCRDRLCRTAFACLSQSQILLLHRGCPERAGKHSPEMLQPGPPRRLSGPPALRAAGEGREEMAVPQQLGFRRGQGWKLRAPMFLGQAQTKTSSRADVWKGSKARSSTSANLRQTRKVAE